MTTNTIITTELSTSRARLEQANILSLSEPADALTAYYALYHAPHQTQLHIQQGQAGIDGFAAVCQTGRNLFQSTVVLRAPDVVAGVEMLSQVLAPGCSYYVITTPQLAPAVETLIDAARIEHNLVYHLNLDRFEPIINVLVEPDQAADGSRRFVVRSGPQKKVVAASGINWRSPRFAEVFVYAETFARGRGWAKSALSACTGHLLREKLRPLYIVQEDNRSSIWLAESLGYIASGAREFAVDGVCRKL